tara:strand:- start:535 stop:747 length:213 start_codon:yes stop_codon:yes gene_type:complete
MFMVGDLVRLSAPVFYVAGECSKGDVGIVVEILSPSSLQDEDTTKQLLLIKFAAKRVYCYSHEVELLQSV